MAHLEFDPFRYKGLLGLKGAEGSSQAFQPRDGVHRSITTGDLTVEIRSLSSAHSIKEAWNDLAHHAIEPNVFFEPDFALAAEQHLPEAAGSFLALVWGPRGGDQRKLLALWPMRPTRRTPFAKLTRGLALQYASSGAPLLDNRFAVEAASALISGLGVFDPSSSAVLFQEIALDGVVARTLRAAATLNDLSFSEIEVHNRACLWPEEQWPVSTVTGTDAEPSSELDRHLLGLSRHGDVRMVRAQSPADIKDAMEIYLAREASGSKVSRGTSILSQTRVASFYRSMTRALSRRGQISIEMLEVGRRIAAASVVLKSGTQGWCVRTTHDEAFVALEPGAFLGHQIAQSCVSDRDMHFRELHFIDSCAVPGHPLVKKYWNGQVRIGDVVISHNAPSATALSREKARSSTGGTAKRFFNTLRGWPT